jgi:dTMP kinase
MPDLTLLFDVDVEIARGRLDARPSRPATLAKLVEPPRNRFDNENLEFHSRVRQGYLDLARAQPERIRVIDASGSPAVLHTSVLELVLPLVGTREALG